jgi:hypothetical protein
MSVSDMVVVSNKVIAQTINVCQDLVKMQLCGQIKWSGRRSQLCIYILVYNLICEI